LENIQIGIIGGSGLYQMAGLAEVQEVRVETPFGYPSDSLVTGTLEGKRVAFLARHGRGHTILPSELNFRANIYAMKKLGVGSRADLIAHLRLLRAGLDLGRIDCPAFVVWGDRDSYIPSTFADAGVSADPHRVPLRAQQASGRADGAALGQGVRPARRLAPLFQRLRPAGPHDRRVRRGARRP
jgi:pimeloyl-ACP methyl ester carboxylesterase